MEKLQEAIQELKSQGLTEDQIKDKVSELMFDKGWYLTAIGSSTSKSVYMAHLISRSNKGFRGNAWIHIDHQDEEVTVRLGGGKGGGLFDEIIRPLTDSEVAEILTKDLLRE